MTTASGVSAEQSTVLLHEYVYRALIGKTNGTDVVAYNNFVREFAALRKKVLREPSGSGTGSMMLANLLHALRDCVSALRERAHDALLGEVLSIKLWEVAPVVRSAVLELVVTLVVVNTAVTHTCLRLLVSSLLPPPAPPALGSELGPWQPSEEEQLVQTAITRALTKVLDHVPTTPAALMQLVGAHLPHKLRDRGAQCLYFSALFRLAECRAGQAVRDGVLAVVVEQLLSLDVDIRWEDIVEAQTAETAEEVEGEGPEEDGEDIFQLEGMSELDLNASPEELEQLKQERLAALQAAAPGPRGGWEGATAGSAAQGPTAAESAAAATAAASVDETANKLDSLMELTFAHLGVRCQQDLPATWAALMDCFERTILNTHRSKFSQFLVFFVCHKHPDPCVRLFAEFLLTRLQDAQLPPITRSACAAYLASFLARCAAAPPAFVLQCLDALTRFVEQYLASASLLPGAGGSQASLHGHGLYGQGNSGGASGGAAAAADLTTKHQVLYAAVQAILYVLCYQLDGLLHHQHTHHHKQTLGDATRALLTQRVLPALQHPLQPLAVCLPSVVSEFRNQLAQHGIAELALPSEMDTTRAAQRPLEMFFPFDPYLLKRSAAQLELQHSYVTWRRGRARGVGRAAGVSSQSDEEAEDEEEEEVVQPGAKGADEEDEDGDLELQSSGSDAESSSDTDEEDGSLRGGSVMSDHMMGSVPKGSGMLSHLKPPAVALKRHHQLPIPRLPSASAQAWGHGRGGGSAAGGKPHAGSGAAPMASSFEPTAMATSYGMGVASSMGDSPVPGTSPVVVEYYTGPVGGQSVSPMQMTPQFHPHMEAVPSRLAARRVR